MSAYQFIKLNAHRILNIDGCLDETSDITILNQNGVMEFYLFENGMLVDDKAKA